MQNVRSAEPRGFRPYDPDPRIDAGADRVDADAAGCGYDALVASLASRLVAGRPTKRSRSVVALDLYQSPGMDAFLARFRTAWESVHGPATWIDTRAALKDPDALATELHEFLTDDPVFGWVCDRDLSIFFDRTRWQALCERVLAATHEPAPDAPLFIVGPGAMLSPLRLYTDAALYAQVPRETIFTASEAGVGRNLGDDRDRGPWPRYKRSFYVDWPVQDRHLADVLSACDFLIDMHDPDAPAFVDTALLRRAMTNAAARPFRIRSLFMPGVWGGKRLQRLIPGLPGDWPNCAWGFEVVAPENTVTFDFAGTPIKTSFELFLHAEPARLLGDDNHRRFGSFFPIRFDFLDTMDGGNLSCQVHPSDAYINARFREPFAQHETYYILESRPGAKVYLGLQESTSRDAFLADVQRAEADHVPFDITKHVNAWDAHRGDLFVIPAGTVHCSGANNLVLEISATPYIYTFKIYDYLRPDLNGQPRPISYHRAFEVIDFTRKTAWVRENLLPQPRLLAEGPGWQRYLLSDLALEFHSIERIELTSRVRCADHERIEIQVRTADATKSPADDRRANELYRDSTETDGVHVLCVVEGDGARILREADGATLDAAYAETVIIPAACGPYRLAPIGPSPVKLVKSYVRT